MSMGNLAWAVLLECLRAEDWETAWALVNLVDVTAPNDDSLDFGAHIRSRLAPRIRPRLFISRPLGVEGEAWVQRRLVDPLCGGAPPEKRPTFKLIEPASQEPFDHAASEIDEMMIRLVLGATVAECSCGATYIAATWEHLELVGTIDDRAEGGWFYEQRNCVCGSTMTRELEP